MSNIHHYTVTELSLSIKNKLEKDYERVSVKGEISGLKKWNGHFLLNLKDDGSLLSARIWRSQIPFIDVNPEEGLEVIARGKLSTHVQRSNYNLIIENIKIAGEGALLKLVEDRKKKLDNLGFFDSIHKKKLPRFPKKIGVITSETGAVIEDIKRRLNDRFPSNILLCPVSVQGVKAEDEIVKAIELFNNIRNQPCIIILARGGGSFEDLLCFNSEKVANAIFKSDIPLISAIGHETDYTISDLVADKRASTPTAAVDVAVPDKQEILNLIKNYYNSINLLLNKKLSDNELKLEIVNSRLITPQIIFTNLKIKYMDLKNQIEKKIEFTIQNKLIKLKNNHLIDFKLRLKNENIIFTKLITDYEKGFKNFFANKSENIISLGKILKSSSYKNWLEKGFAILKDEKNKIIREADKIKPEKIINIILAKSQLKGVLKKITYEKNNK